MSVENNSNRVTLVTTYKIDSLEKLVRWLSFDGLNYTKLYNYTEYPYGPCPLERYDIILPWGLPISKKYKKTALELVVDTSQLAREKPEEFAENSQNRCKISIIKDFLRELEKRYSENYFEVRELLRIPIIRNLLDIQN